MDQAKQFVSIAGAVAASTAATVRKSVSENPTVQRMASNPRIVDGRERLTKFFSQPKLVLTYLWLATLAISALYAIAAIVAAVNNHGHHSPTRSLTFAALWNLFLVSGLAVGGTYVIRKFHTPIVLGALIGAVATMALQQFAWTILWSSATKGPRHTPYWSNWFMAAFSFLLCSLYTSFAIVLGRNTETVLQQQPDLESAIPGPIEVNPSLAKLNAAARQPTPSPESRAVPAPVSV